MASLELTCVRCGAALPPGARFCLSCGAPVAEVAREERRVVTVLFGDLSGFTEFSEERDAEQVKALVDRAFAQAGEIIARFGGHVDKIIGDEIMAVFGAPVAHEDDAERAVRAALAIQRDLTERTADVQRAHGILLRMHIGVNTGEVVAGFVAGSDSYTVLGDTVNTARRISDAAEAGQILVGEPTVEASRGAIEYRRVGQVTAKGKRLPLAVWEAVTETGLPGARALRAAPLIGREEEIAVLGSLANIARRDRRPLVATLIGEAGMGKSRLAAEFGRRVSSHGVRVLNGRSLPYGTASPAFALEEMARQALMLEPEADADDVRGRLEALGLGADTETVLAFLGLGVASATVAQPPGAPSPDGYTSPLIDAAIAVLRATADREGMLICAFHEIHWAEDEVLDAVLRIAREMRAPIMALCLARPDLLERRADWSSALGSTVLPLEQLPRARAAEMLDMLAPELPPTVRENVLDRAGGNPFYLEELARLYVDEKAAAFAVPPTVQALVTARLDALPAREKRALQDAAVVGEEFWEGALAELHATVPDTVVLPSLAAQGFIDVVPSSIPGETGYRFRQTLVREVAYGSVPKQARAGQHEVVARWLEEVASAAGKDRDLSDLIAHHYERAAKLAHEVGGSAPDAETKARAYLRRAGDAALEHDALAAALRFYERALVLGEDDLDLRLRLAETLVGTFQLDRAHPHLEAALERARVSSDVRAEARALRLLSDALRMGGNNDAAREPLERALELSSAAGEDAEQAEAFRSRGLLDLMSGKPTDATGWFEKAAARYRELGDLRGQGWSAQNLGWANMIRGRYEVALEHFAAGEQLFTELGDQEGIGWCRSMRGWALLQRGHILEARSIAEDMERKLTHEHAEYAKTAGFALELQRVLRAFVAIARGRLQEAVDIARLATETQAWTGATFAQALGRYPITVAHILERRFDEAREEIVSATASMDQKGDPFYLALYRFADAWVAVEQARFEDAVRILDEMGARWESGRGLTHTLGASWITASALRGRGQTSEARALLEERIDERSTRRGGVAAATGNLSLPASWSRALLADLLVEEGDIPRAREAAAAAAEESGEIVIGRVVALTSQAGVELAAERPSAAQPYVRDALALLEETDWAIARVRVLALHAQVLDALRRHDEAADALDGAQAIFATLPPGTDIGPLEALLRG